jgi:hypothetical protein
MFVLSYNAMLFSVQGDVQRLRVKQARSQTKFSGGAKQIFGGALYINVLNINAIFNLFTLTSN